MAKIISSRKKYVLVKDLKVYPSNKDGQGWYYDNPPIFDGESWNVDPTYDCLECMGAVNDLHPANLFSFPIPEDMTYEDEPIKFEICLK